MSGHDLPVGREGQSGRSHGEPGSGGPIYDAVRCHPVDLVAKDGSFPARSEFQDGAGEPPVVGKRAPGRPVQDARASRCACGCGWESAFGVVGVSHNAFAQARARARGEPPGESQATARLQDRSCARTTAASSRPSGAKRRSSTAPGNASARATLACARAPDCDLAARLARSPSRPWPGNVHSARSATSPRYECGPGGRPAHGPRPGPRGPRRRPRPPRRVRPSGDLARPRTRPLWRASNQNSRLASARGSAHSKPRGSSTPGAG